MAGSTLALLVQLMVTHAAAQDSCGLEDHVEFLQSSMKEVHRIGLSESVDNAQAFLKQNSSQGQFDCSDSLLCTEPINCQEYDGSGDLMTDSSMRQFFAVNGEPYLQSWCQPENRGYEDFAYQCLVEKDLVKAAHLQYEHTMRREYGQYVPELDGSYCFIEGHCLNTAVTNSTTLEEANKMCVDRFGLELFSNPGEVSTISDIKNERNGMDNSNGFNGSEQTTPFLLDACAMGNYHCDVIYCKENYCKQPDMIAKYQHWLSYYGWDKCEEPWFTR